MMYEQDIDFDRPIIDRNLGFMDQHKTVFLARPLFYHDNSVLEFRHGKPWRLIIPKNVFCGRPKPMSTDARTRDCVNIRLNFDSIMVLGPLYFYSNNGITMYPHIDECFFARLLGFNKMPSEYMNTKMFKRLCWNSCFNDLPTQHFSLLALDRNLGDKTLNDDFEMWCNHADDLRKLKRGSTYAMIKSFTMCAKKLSYNMRMNFNVFYRHEDYPTFNIFWVTELPMLCIPKNRIRANQMECEAFVGVYDLDVCRICGITLTTLHELIRMHDPDYKQVLWLSDGNHCELADAFYKHLIYRMNSGYKSNSILMNGVSTLPPLMDRFLNIKLVRRIFKTATGRSEDKRLPSQVWCKIEKFSLVDVTYNAQT